jgi:hypothetical protein
VAPLQSLDLLRDDWLRPLPMMKPLESLQPVTRGTYLLLVFAQSQMGCQHRFHGSRDLLL